MKKGTQSVFKDTFWKLHLKFPLISLLARIQSLGHIQLQERQGSIDFASTAIFLEWILGDSEFILPYHISRD